MEIRIDEDTVFAIDTLNNFFYEKGYHSNNEGVEQESCLVEWEDLSAGTQARLKRLVEKTEAGLKEMLELVKGSLQGRDVDTLGAETYADLQGLKLGGVL